FFTITEQFCNRVGGTFRLIHLLAAHQSTTTHDTVTGAAQAGRVSVNGSRAGFELAGKAIMDTPKAILLRIAEAEIGKELPDIKRQITDKGLLYFTIPTHEARNERPGNPVCKEEVDLLVLEESIPKLPGVHPIDWKWTSFRSTKN